MWVLGDGQFRYESGVFPIEINENERSQNERADESISSKRSRGTCKYEYEMESERTGYRCRRRTGFDGGFYSWICKTVTTDVS